MRNLAILNCVGHNFRSNIPRVANMISIRTDDILDISAVASTLCIICLENYLDQTFQTNAESCADFPHINFSNSSFEPSELEFCLCMEQYAHFFLAFLQIKLRLIPLYCLEPLIKLIYASNVPRVKNDWLCIKFKG